MIALHRACSESTVQPIRGADAMPRGSRDEPATEQVLLSRNANASSHDLGTIAKATDDSSIAHVLLDDRAGGTAPARRT